VAALKIDRLTIWPSELSDIRRTGGAVSVRTSSHESARRRLLRLPTHTYLLVGIWATQSRQGQQAQEEQRVLSILSIGSNHMHVSIAVACSLLPFPSFLSFLSRACVSGRSVCVM
jgi:hypothetical protein